MNTQSGGFEDWVAGLVTRDLKGVMGTVQGNVRGREYVGYDSSISIESYRVVGFTRCETGFEARKRRQTWNHDQLAKGTARPGKFSHWAAAGPNSLGDIAPCFATLGFGASLDGFDP